MGTGSYESLSFLLCNTNRSYYIDVMASATKVTLIPWDPNSEAHVELLVKQRVECSWDQEKVETKWKGQQLQGEKCIYWIVSA
jgi:hypothetical protein